MTSFKYGRMIEKRREPAYEPKLKELRLCDECEAVITVHSKSGLCNSCCKRDRPERHGGFLLRDENGRWTDSETLAKRWLIRK